MSSIRSAPEHHADRIGFCHHHSAQLALRLGWSRRSSWTCPEKTPWCFSLIGNASWFYHLGWVKIGIISNISKKNQDTTRNQHCGTGSLTQEMTYFNRDTLRSAVHLATKLVMSQSNCICGTRSSEYFPAWQIFAGHGEPNNHAMANDRLRLASFVFAC